MADPLLICNTDNGADDDVDDSKITNNLDILPYDNGGQGRESDASTTDPNIATDNLEDNLPNSEDKSRGSQESNVDDTEGNTLISLQRVNFVTQVADEQEQSTTNIDKLRSYIQTQCYEGSKWYHSLFFEGTKDKLTFERLDVIQYVGNSLYEDKEDNNSYRIYFDPKKYSVKEELATLSSIPDDATVRYKTQQRFKSPDYVKLSKDLRLACGHCGFNIIQNGNQKFDFKRNGLIVRSRLSCQRYLVHKGFARNITGNHEFCRYTFHNNQKNQRTLGRKKSRRSYSARSTTKATRCNFFYINFDEYGFYVVPGLGTRYHCHHSPINKAVGSTHQDKLEDNEQSLIKDMADGQAADAQIQNIVFNKTGKLVPRCDR